MAIASLAAVSLGALTVPTSAFAGAAPSEYVVKPGDFLAGIAAKVGTTLPALLSVNNLTAKSLILPGEKLMVPPVQPLPRPQSPYRPARLPAQSSTPSSPATSCWASRRSTRSRSPTSSPSTRSPSRA